MPAKLYVVPASHPCVAVMRALDLKGIPYERVDLVPVFHKLHQRIRFRKGSTVPGIVLEDGRRILGSRAIVRVLDETVPQPRLLPEDAEARKRVEEAEAWGEEVLQPIVRRVLWLALSRDTSAQLSYSEGSKLFPPVPTPIARLSGGIVAFGERRLNDATEPSVRADLASLPRHLDRVDGWIRDGVLGAGATPNAADLQVASGLRLLLTVDDVAPLIEPRPAGELARRVFPDYPGRVPAGTLPPEWIPVQPEPAAA